MSNILLQIQKFNGEQFKQVIEYFKRSKIWDLHPLDVSDSCYDRRNARFFILFYLLWVLSAVVLFLSYFFNFRIHSCDIFRYIDLIRCIHILRTLRKFNNLYFHFSRVRKFHICHFLIYTICRLVMSVAFLLCMCRAMNVFIRFKTSHQVNFWLRH